MATTNGTTTSTFASPDSTGKLSRHDAAAYLDRISLSHSLLDQPPSLDLLRTLQSSHILAVPFESLSLHVKDWQDDEADIYLGGGEVVGLGEAAFNRIVHLRRGGFCFSINSSFAALLRFWNFRVSECAARVYSHQRKDPQEAGWSWEPTSHQISIVDWEGSSARWFVDVGFGSAQCSYPIEFKDGASQTSIPAADYYELHRTDRLPGASPSLQPDLPPYWTVYRRNTASSGSTYLSPVYSFALASVPFVDFRVLNTFQFASEHARFRTFLVATILRPDGERRTLQYLDGMEDPQHEGRRAAKLYTTTAVVEGKREDEKEVEWVEMRVGAVREALEREFGMRFPSSYSGN
ncbi:uncharacterized protein RHOBADRAFT_44040 [Rhodotorula graminis WP1]|uniref:Uncharacterized protein n=1 Tax=Rhodotorula graminis (strain WP1) TaxID=578459 RepID=A0A194S476_RHOGW|nr:uncharacterized protein RHOBADRAFT_44040 [Rhodotorula graminis WP1]KPV75533.1 hypothetical protein RHOBADRAFT_44040 [Rhodotorula graminis WP1]